MGIIIALVSFVIGTVIGLIIQLKCVSVGNLRIDQSDSTSAPYLFLELDTDVCSIICKEYVTFRVKVEDFLPHE